MIKKIAAYCFSASVLGATLAGCGGGGDTMVVSSGTVIRHATIVNTADGTLTTGKSVLVDNGKIKSITGRPIQTTDTAQSVDGSGKFIVPGYLDMHTHAMAAADQQPAYWPLLIANGITGVREMSGSAEVIRRIGEVNAASAAGQLDAPEILTRPGEIFAGQSTTAAGAIQFVQRQLASGADFIKVIGGNREAVMAVLAEAKSQGSYVAGHLVPAVSAQDASNAGWRVIEHLGSGWGLQLDCATDAAAVRLALASGQGANPPFPATFTVNPRVFDAARNARFYQRIFDTYDAGLCQSLAKTFVANGTWQVPTLIRLRTQSFGNDPLYRNDPNLVYVDKTRRALWNQLGDEFDTNVPKAAQATLQQYHGLHQKVTRLLSDSGVKMLAGSDLGGIWVIPGFSLHQEFRELSAAGLTPLQILQATTLNGAEFLHRESAMGSVAEGKNADLVLLDANPLADVANLEKISAVFLKGRYFPKAALEKMKSDVAAAYETQTLKALHTALDPTDID
jgi:imidazolonepropionase-like amidohydrolase